MRLKSARAARSGFTVLGLILILGYSTAAMAQVDATNAFSEVAKTIEEKLIAFSTNTSLAEIGWQLFGFFVAANVIYMLLKNMTVGSGINGIIADAVPLLIAGAVVVLFLSKGLTTAIADSMNVLTGAIAGSSNSSLAGLMTSAAGTAGLTIRNLWELSPTTGTSSPGGLAALGEILLGIPAVLMNIVAMIVGVFFVVVALCIYLASLVISQIGIYIALMLAPFFVPFLLFPPASFLFNGWLRFFLSSALLKTIGLILLQVTDVIMQGVLQISQSTQTAGTSGADALVFDIVKYAMIILLAGLGALLMSQASSIANALISGGGGPSFSGWSSLASKSAATRGIMGGMSLSGSGPGAKSGNMLSGIANAAPNFAKPVVNAAGKGASQIAGRTLAKSDMNAARAGGASNGERNIGRDVSQMSKATAGAYTSRIETMNASVAKREGSAGFYGPPSPRYTVGKPVSSTAPRGQQTRR